MINSKQKGARFERTLAGLFREQGYDARRTQQYCGATEEASDVTGLPYIHVEAKHYKNRAFDYDWLEQAKRDAKNGNMPAVFHKTDNHEILVTMRLEDWFKIYREYEVSTSLKACLKENNML
jgi:hypothetical protein